MYLNIGYFKFSDKIQSDKNSLEIDENR